MEEVDEAVAVVMEEVVDQETDEHRRQLRIACLSIYCLAKLFSLIQVLTVQFL